MYVQPKYGAQDERLAPVQLEFQEDDIAILLLGDPEEKVVLLSQERLDAFRDALVHCKGNRPAGLVILSCRADMFCAGLDISLLNSHVSEEAIKVFLKGYQDLFNEISSLPFPTAAAISGPCVGGGLELALACRHRIVSDHKSTQIGLPEVKLGLVPGFGGTQRLPRLIGIRPTLDLILSGRMLTPQEALQIGLVHEVVSFHRLRDRAAKLLRGELKASSPRLPMTERFFTYTSLGRKRTCQRASKLVGTQAGHLLPAPAAAIEAVMTGLAEGEDRGLECERSSVTKLLATAESKALIHVYYLTNAAKALGKSAKKTVEHILAVVIGGGTMGAAATCLLAKGECSVVIKDVSEDALARGMTNIRAMLSSMTNVPETEKSFILNRIGTTTSDTSSISNANFALEAVPEDVELKKSVLAEISKSIAHDAVLATNTSALSVSEIASKIDAPSRVVGFHCFNPVMKMPLVEVIRGKHTSDKTLAIAASLAVKLGKLPIIVNDAPGFLVNRIVAPYFAEAIKMLSEGIHPATLDLAAQEFGLQMGPLRLMDEIGLDVVAAVAQSLKRTSARKLEGPDYLDKLLRLGHRGKKSGLGFYNHASPVPVLAPDLRDVLSLPRDGAKADSSRIIERLVFCLINEALSCLDQGVAGFPGKEAAGQIDLASVMGLGFPAFRGGIIYYAETLGPGAVLERMSVLEREHGERFSPWRGIGTRASMGKSFYSAT